MTKVVLRIVGDNLITEMIYKSAKKGETCDFKHQYTEIAPLIKEADIAVVDQETILVPDKESISFFPLFATPMEAADALVNAGFNVVIQGTNHALDKGYRGICNDIEIWRRYSDRILQIGIYDSPEAAGKIPVVEKSGIRIALLNYTESINGHHKPLGKSYCVNTMKSSDRRKILLDIKRAREEADVVVILPHWGVEYIYEPAKSQIEWARFFAEEGADLIIGTHPHVLQYQEVIKTSDGREVPCYYSLGNFISSHTNLQGVVIGGMADIEFTRDDTGKVTITRHDIIPTVTHTDSNLSYFKVVRLQDYTNEMAAESKLISIINQRLNDDVDADRLRSIYGDIMDRKALEKSIFKRPSDVFLFNVRSVFKSLRKKQRK